MQPLQSELEKCSSSYAKKQQVFESAQALLAWPAEVIRHSLRPAPALISRILQMRGALKAL
jgi:DNA polymerase-3 subunit delta'